MTTNPQDWATLLSSPWTYIFSILLSVIVPVAGYVLFRVLSSPGGIARRPGKMRTYANIIFMEWALVGALLWLISRNGLSLSTLGENLGDTRITVAATAALLAVFAVQVALNIRQLHRTEPAKLAAELAELRRFLPANSIETFVFMFIAVTAGFCEELLYRGWLQNMIAASTGSVWVGLVVGAAVFGCGHAYQGKSGMIQTGVIGLIFGGVFIFTKSLVAGQILHMTIDAVNGIVGGYAVSLLNSKSGEHTHN